ncbi:MAG: DUF262 domain-containing protein [Candidatus Electrothrix sp. LOE1_4_5]|nr:DUF262 domain-containing protein [Candidatus Electrothrix gigas]
MILDIDQAFNTNGHSVYDFFQRPGIGFYIPLYQREYSWDKDNINQLLEDISKGVESLTANAGSSEDEIRFLGTIISVVQADKTKIEPLDNKGLPSSIEKIIDGQQRLTTICLIAVQLYKHIKIRRDNNIPKDSEFHDEIIEACDLWLDKLLDIISLNLGKGKIKRKPQLIRGQKDKWVKDGPVDGNYNSPLANYIGHFLEYIFLDSIEEPPAIDKSNNVGKNTFIIESWFNKIVTQAHVRDDDEFVPAWSIIENNNEEDIWDNDRPELVELLRNNERTNKKSLSYTCCSLVQLFSVCHYMLERCCFTHIQPTNDDWAFDMFQSLNASGTPLTAIETFKPLVHNVTELKEGNFRNSVADKSFVKIENLFNKTNTAAQKSKLTNSFLISFCLVIDGKKMQSHFSHQRKWLNKIYQELPSYEDQKDFIVFFGNYANFYDKVWQQYKGKDNIILENIQSNQEGDLASLLLIYLKESNHNMSIVVLSWLYIDMIQNKEGAVDKFIDALKTIVAFYTIWRSCRSNSGIDNVYRKYFEENCWIKSREFDLDNFKRHLRENLTKHDILERENWIKKSKQYLRYNKAKSVCKFILFVSSHDTIPDDLHPGLIKAGTKNCSPYLKLERWNSEKLKTIEHIAPEKGNELWDEHLYGDDKMFNSIGNLTLLPATVNTSASNKGWAEKHVYYLYLSAKDPEDFTKIENEAKEQGISLSSYCRTAKKFRLQ